jgi:hypothetical protein
VAGEAHSHLVKPGLLVDPEDQIFKLMGIVNSPLTLQQRCVGKEEAPLIGCLQICLQPLQLLCGNVAVQSILGNIGGITRIRGKWFDGGEVVHGAKLMAIFHPSYLLRNDSREKGSPKWLMWQDIQEIRREYDKL